MSLSEEEQAFSLSRVSGGDPILDIKQIFGFQSFPRKRG